MAKKKKTKEKAKAKPKKRDYHLYLYLLGVVILLVIIIVLIKSGKKEAGPADVVVTPPVEEIKETEEPELSGAIEKNDCGTGAAIGYKACELLGNGDVKLTVLHTGGDALAGAQYYIFDMNGEKIAEKMEAGIVEGGAEASYVLPLSQYAGAKKVEVRPVVQIAGENKICVNQHVIVIPSTSCR